MKGVDRRWVEAGVILAENPDAYVECPVCTESTLEVEDIPNPKDPKLFDRHIRCSNCGAEQILVRMKSR
jgi:hypothetical protein